MEDIQKLQAQFEHVGYVTEPDLAATLMLMEALQRPLLLEGDAGVGKTEIAKVLSKVNDCPLIRLQCYEGLDVNAAVYEWNYQRQLLAIKIQESSGLSSSEKE
ncbi:MAG: AAA family ATPase, partial [Pseudomonadota bacterium]